MDVDPDFLGLNSSVTLGKLFHLLELLRELNELIFIKHLEYQVHGQVFELKKISSEVIHKLFSPNNLVLEPLYLKMVLSTQPLKWQDVLFHVLGATRLLFRPRVWSCICWECWKKSFDHFCPFSYPPLLLLN